MIDFETLPAEIVQYIEEQETLLKQEQNKNQVIVSYLKRAGERIKCLLRENETLIDNQALSMVAMNKQKAKKIRIKYVRDVLPVSSIDIGDWIDLRCAENVEMSAGQYKMIPLGVAMELPEGYEALVVPRSSTFKKYGIVLANSIGVIDEAYKGDNDEWNFLAYAVTDAKIPKNERICQFRIIKHQPDIVFQTVEFLGNINRGGIGSTGRI